MSIWALKEDHIEPFYDFEQILAKNKVIGDDMRASLVKKHNFREKDSLKYEEKILSESRFYEFFKLEG